ncbi:DEAD/DEAH box helicase [Paraburkholderia hospita]|nr:DEAD/DEAH box helicase [Paraburkholderia hospita]
MNETTHFRMQRPWSRQAAAELLDMSGKLKGFEDVGAKQLDAAVALHRMLLTHGSAYLGDEVGMGKTYVALATVALFRHLQPGFRVLYLAPSQNVLSKWHGRELPAFIRNNVRHADMRLRRPDGTPPARSAACMRVDDWLKCAVSDRHVLDVFVPLSALSFQLYGECADWCKRVKALAEHGGVQVDLEGVTEKKTFKDRAAEIINKAIPFYDLVVIDEAHLLKGGAGTAAADRARFLARALGANRHGGTRRFGAALLLSGTPFDRDLSQLARQFELVAQPDAELAPHQAIASLAARKRNGEKWSALQAGLKPYMIRRVQKLQIGGVQLSRNQYRVELRAEAGISLADDKSARALRQRIFTAVVQKRLIEHLDGANEGRFPMAMFSSWEAYSPPRKTKDNKAEPIASHGDDGDDTQRAADSNALDTSKDDAAPRDARAVDGALMEDIVGSYREAFDEEPPHPKLEAETLRLGNEAFGQGLKQLIFVRRLKSVDDLYLRLNEAYDKWLGEYLRAEGMPGCPDQLMAARRVAAKAGRAAPPIGGASPATRSREKSDELPAHGDTLFSWFFRGELDGAGEDFIARQKPALPVPSVLRERLRTRVESIIGELDWRRFLADRCPGLPDIPVWEIAALASRLQGATTPFMRYRRLQAAWAQLQAERLPVDRARPFRVLREHLITLLYDSGAAAIDHIDTETAEKLLCVPTVALAFYRNGLGEGFLPAWGEAWRELAIVWQGANACKRGADWEEACRTRLEALDLQHEVLFALLRLDHPFIDLYLGWLKAERDDGYASAQSLVDRMIDVCNRDPHGTRFGTASILRNLAEGWEQIAKTNFAEFLKGVDRKNRKQWRQGIQQLLTPFAPVEWASGHNTDGRSAIARRFRMPGYPMALVSTSVLQEGEDLHVCCDRVTHFGISGSPIGIEQKNGRVDRIGSRAQRRLLTGQTVREAGIRVNFPHLSESLEWYQIRDLSISINDYLRSIHEVGAVEAVSDLGLAQTMASSARIPSLLRDPLHSPFEPQWTEEANDVSREEVLRVVADTHGVDVTQGTRQISSLSAAKRDCTPVVLMTNTNELDTFIATSTILSDLERTLLSAIRTGLENEERFPSHLRCEVRPETRVGFFDRRMTRGRDRLVRILVGKLQPDVVVMSALVNKAPELSALCPSKIHGDGGRMRCFRLSERSQAIEFGSILARLLRV